VMGWLRLLSEWVGTDGEVVGTERGRRHAGPSQTVRR
jgi:hypothetical protein